MQEMDEKILILKDAKTVPDVVCEYTSREQKASLIIDNGSFQSRVGFSNRKEPQLIFRNLVAKPRKDRSKKEEVPNVQQPVLIGNDIVNIETMRFQLRTQFDRNIVTHFYLQEQIFDYIFTHLGINTETVNHPIVLTESAVNPNYCRSLMSELLFECYQVPSVCYGIDSLFSFSLNDSPKGTGLIVSIGYTTTHVIPYIDGRHISDKIRRMNVGGSHMLSYLHRLLQLKYPVHVNNITLSRVEELLHNHCSIAYDYKDALKLWSSHDHYEKSIRKIQLPFSQVIAAPTLTNEQKTEKRKEMSRRLAEINARKREEKLAEDEDQLQRLIEIKESYDEEDEEEYEMGLQEFNLTTSDELDKLISVTKARIEKIKHKMQAVESGVVVEEKQITIPQPPAEKTMEEWLVEIREKKTAILEKKQIRKQRRSDLAKRRTAAAQERMRIISKLAGKEKGTDDFGSRDEDWDVYKVISREQDSDSEVENEKLLEYDDILRHHDPFLNDNDEPQLKMGMAEYHQLHFGVEAIRATEILFQPSSMIGVGEAGLAETIDYVLKLFSPEDQQRLVSNVFLTGGVAKIPGLRERLNKELMEMRPFQSTFGTKLAKDPSLDAWNGARHFALNSSLLKEFATTRKDYDEKGGEYLKEYFASNTYFPTPVGVPLNTSSL